MIRSIDRRYRADRFYRVKRLNAKFAMDTIYADCKTLQGHIGAQVYTTKFGFNVAYNIHRATGEELGNTLNDFANNYGTPALLTTDGALTQTGKNTLFMKK